MENNVDLISKWGNLIWACKSYYVDCVPTGMTDAEYDRLESAAARDGFFVRDYVFETYLKGTKTLNQYIEKIKKTKVENSTMIDAIKSIEQSLGENLYCTLKYDGSSIAIYLDSTTGRPRKVVTCGNLNGQDYGVDQTWKLLKFLPRFFPKGILAIQCEALIDLRRISEGDPDRARQKANGLINSKYCDSEVSNLLTLRAYRYYTDNSAAGQQIKNTDYRKVIESLPTSLSKTDGHILFCPAQVWTSQEIPLGYAETDKTVTNTGEFLNDGWVLYGKDGICRGALKFAGAGSGTELIKTTVQGIQWNDQTIKGKDSWSANVIVNPVTIKGCQVRKPSAGSVAKLVKNKITPGAEVSIILANSTIPMVGQVFSAGNGDFNWPVCECGYKMSENDVYGSLLKCGNKHCTARLSRMYNYLKSLNNIHQDLDLNKLLVIDRFKWETTNIDINKLLGFIEQNNGKDYYNYLISFMDTTLRKRNLDLVCEASFMALRKIYEEQ